MKWWCDMRGSAIPILLIAAAVILYGCGCRRQELHIDKNGNIVPGITSGYSLVIKNSENYFSGTVKIACNVNSKEVGVTEFSNFEELCEFPVNDCLSSGNNVVEMRFLADQSDCRFEPVDWKPAVGDERDFVHLAVFRDGALVMEHDVKLVITGSRVGSDGREQVGFSFRNTTASFNVVQAPSPGSGKTG